MSRKNKECRQEKQAKQVDPISFLITDEDISEEYWSKLEGAEFDLDLWVQQESAKVDDCVVSTKHGKGIEANARKILNIARSCDFYPDAVVNRMQHLFNRRNFQGVLDVSSRFDLVDRWMKSINDTPINKSFQEWKKLDGPPSGDDRLLDMENSWEGE